ncbi:MAG: flagellar hook-basal body complex protein [Helicobacteraceae bacterium]
MMRSLWSGVSGLTTHQTGMDVEGNNIANVNTPGFKKSRANFEDYSPQTMNPAKAPDGKRGGKNPTQVGLGSSVANVQNIHTQGNFQTTNVGTDLATNGNGYFMVSNNGGKKNYYTRDGRFSFDGAGNLVNPNGYVAQGWMADKHHEINSTVSTKNIKINKNMVIPGKETTKAALQGNLNSGTVMGEKERSPATTTLTSTSDLNGLFSHAGKEITLRKNIDKVNMILKRKFMVDGVEKESTSLHTFTYGKSASQSDGFFTTIGELLEEINHRIKDSTGTFNNKVLLTGDGEIAAAGHIVAVNGPQNPKSAASTMDMKDIRNYDGLEAGMQTGDQIVVRSDPANGGTGVTTTLTYGTDFTTIADLVARLDALAGGNGSVTYDEVSGIITDKSGALANLSVRKADGKAPDGGSPLERLGTMLNTIGGKNSHTATIRGNTFYDTSTTNEILHEAFQEASKGYYLSKPLKTIKNSYIGADDVGELFNEKGEKMMVKSGDGVNATVSNLKETRKFIYRENKADNKLSYLNNDFQDPSDTTIAGKDQSFRWLRDGEGNKAFLTTGQKIVMNFDPNTQVGKAMGTRTYTYGTPDGFRTIEDLIKKVNLDLEAKGFGDKAIKYDEINGWIEDKHNILAGMKAVKSNGTDPDANTPLARLNKMLSGISTAPNSHTEPLKKNDKYYFSNIQELANLYQSALDDAADKTNSELASDAIRGRVSVDQNGQIVIKNLGSTTFNVTTTAYPDDKKANKMLLNNMGSLSNSEIVAGAESYSNRFMGASMQASFDIYDKSGTKTQVTLHFKKAHTANKPNDASVWNWYADVPKPATVGFPAFGRLLFNADGSLRGFTPPSLRINSNAGFGDGQNVQLNFGTTGGFDGFTSLADDSDVKTPQTDGYGAGTLTKVSVDETGTILGTFSNSQTKKLAQVALATFANPDGMDKEGGNLFSENSNSGKPNVGAALSGDRGRINPGRIEMSNVDLSESLTNLIIIQRGFQANSKTITTSDQMLNTLLQLKQ